MILSGKISHIEGQAFVNTFKCCGELLANANKSAQKHGGCTAELADGFISLGLLVCTAQGPSSGHELTVFRFTDHASEGFTCCNIYIFIGVNCDFMADEERIK